MSQLTFKNKSNIWTVTRTAQYVRVIKSIFLYTIFGPTNSVQNGTFLFYNHKPIWMGEAKEKFADLNFLQFLLDLLWHS